MNSGAGLPWSQPLLPSEPRVVDAPRQQALTAHHLLPALEALQALMFELRAQVDPVLRARQPAKLGKAYPLGQCLEISLAVQEHLSRLKASDLRQPRAAQGLMALRGFQQAGGTFRRVWGDLRGEFFQNAFQLGTLYLDVSNDTVTPTKPKVEILPFEESGLLPVRDHAHYAERARHYWGDEVFPNHVLPDVAPQAPLLHLRRDGRLEIHSSNRYMVALAAQSGYETSEPVLRAMAPMPQAVFERARRMLMDAGIAPAETPEQGRERALQLARQWRRQRHHLSPEQVRRTTDRLHAANAVLMARPAPGLASRMHPPLATAAGNRSTIPIDTSPVKPMTNTVRLDHREYELSSLSPMVRAQVDSIRYLEQELSRLHGQIGALQTARDTCLQALRVALAEVPPLAGPGPAGKSVG